MTHANKGLRAEFKAKSPGTPLLKWLLAFVQLVNRSFVSFRMNEIFVLFLLSNAGKSKKGMTTSLCGAFVSSK